MGVESGRLFTKAQLDYPSFFQEPKEGPKHPDLSDVYYATRKKVLLWDGIPYKLWLQYYRLIALAATAGTFTISRQLNTSHILFTKSWFPAPAYET